MFAGICKTRSLQNVPSVPQMRGKRRRGGEFRCAIQHTHALKFASNWKFIYDGYSRFRESHLIFLEFIREQLSDDSADSADISPVETAPSDDHVLSTCTLPVRGNPRRRKPDHQHPLQRACNLGEHSADQPNMKVTQSGTRRSNELDYALAEQLCSLQTLVRNSYKWFGPTSPSFARWLNLWINCVRKSLGRFRKHEYMKQHVVLSLNKKATGWHLQFLNVYVFCAITIKNY